MSSRGTTRIATFRPGPVCLSSTEPPTLILSTACTTGGLDVRAIGGLDARVTGKPDAHTTGGLDTCATGKIEVDAGAGPLLVRQTRLPSVASATSTATTPMATSQPSRLGWGCGAGRGGSMLDKVSAPGEAVSDEVMSGGGSGITTGDEGAGLVSDVDVDGRVDVVAVGALVTVSEAYAISPMSPLGSPHSAATSYEPGCRAAGTVKAVSKLPEASSEVVASTLPGEPSRSTQWTVTVTGASRSDVPVEGAGLPAILMMGGREVVGGDVELGVGMQESKPLPLALTWSPG